MPEHSVRIRDIGLTGTMSSSLVAKSPAWVGLSFPALEQLHLSSPESDEFVVLASAFLGTGGIA